MPSISLPMIILLALLLILPSISLAQLNENFNDGNLNQGTVWQGDLNSFKVNNNQQLQLYSSGEGSSFLSTIVDGNVLFEWNFWVKLSFSPSDNNQALIYLTSDNSNLTAPLDGFYIKLGETGSGDAIELYRQYQNEHFLIARGTDGILNEAFAVRIKVTRDDGHWQIYADPTGNRNFQLEATGDDEYWKPFEYFGLLCKYTSSNSTKFYFDDFYAGQLIVDHEPPQLLQVKLSGAANIDLYFNESMQSISCQQVSNYSVNNDFGSPLAAGTDPGDFSIVHLLFQDDFLTGMEYELSVSNLKDLVGNTIQLVIIPFSYDPLKSFDIVINEIMADPDPEIGLPACEYLELYNRTSHEIRMNDWQLSIGDTKKPLPEITIAPHSYYLLTGTGHDSLLNVYGNVSAITGFALTNAGTLISLKDNNDAVIHSISYNDQWYHDATKEEGGWSLEQVDANNPCGAFNNWRASTCLQGGTPGTLNSVNSSNTDYNNPYIEFIAPEEDSSFTVYFNEVMDSIALQDPINYNCDHGVGYPIDVVLNPPLYNSATLIFGVGFIADTVYKLSFSTKLKDCSGNELIGNLTSFFGLPQKAAHNDIVLNELLFDPHSSGAEFTEVYNRSTKIIDLSNLWIACRDATTGDFKSPCRISGQGRLLFPNDYMVLTKQPQLVKADYFTPNPRSFIEMTTFPALANSGGTITLITSDSTIIDELTYSEEMHFALLNTTKGVSLERIDFNRPTGEAGNWHSAAQSVGFATPGYCNSQFMQTGITRDEVNVEPETFSPDNDGYNDQLSIVCRFDQPGYLISIRIFDSNGRFIRLIAANHLAGALNNFNWDGTNFNGEKAPNGIYIIYTEIFNLKGEVKQYKDVAVLAGY